MPFTLGIAQASHHVGEDALSLIRGSVRIAADSGCRMLVFPESLMGPWDARAGRYVHTPEPLDGPFCQSVDALAREFGMWIVYTTEEERPEDPGHPYNTAVVVDDTGIQRGSYRKIHLFDAGEQCESDRMAPGDRPPLVVETPFCTLGVGICYDLRFPEVARSLVLRGADLIVFPSSWVAGPHKVEQWRTLLAARAIENECFVAGVDHTGDGRIGSSCVVDPQGTTIASAGTEELLLTCLVDLDDVTRARKAMPVLEHRRPELYL